MQLLFLIKQPVFTLSQFDRLSNIFDNAGQVIFGVAVLSPIISGFDKTNILVIALGMLGILGCWIVSIWLAKRSEKYDI